MMNVTRSSVFPASRGEVFERLQRLETLQRVAWPFATFEPVGEDAGVWKPGDVSSYRFRLFGCIPFGTHTIRVIRFGLDEGVYTHEGNEHVPTWNHRIDLEPLTDGSCHYTDCVDIGAGWKTPFIWLWAKAFYAHRQRVWVRLLRKKLGQPARSGLSHMRGGFAGESIPQARPLRRGRSRRQTP